MTTQNLYIFREFKDGSAVELDTRSMRIKVWLGDGLPNYAGDVDSMASIYPSILDNCVNAGILSPAAM